MSVLHVVATPIGNLGDFSKRAIAILEGADIVLCEDTRHTRKLLNHYGIEARLKSHHQFNEAKSLDGIIASLQEGKMVALVSDAGTPLIADPGQRLVSRCRSEGIEVVSIPGPCALIAALSISGLSFEKFQFIGFLPKRSGRLERALREAIDYEGITVAYETPHRIQKSLAMLVKIAPEQEIHVARELTKKFEEMISGTPTELLERFKHPKGEMVVLIDGQ